MVLFVGIIMIGGCIGEKKEIEYSTHSGDKSTFKYPNNLEDMDPSKLGMPQLQDIKYIIKMEKNKYSFIIFVSVETERVPITENQLDLYIDDIKQGYGITGSGGFSVIDKKIVNDDEAIVEGKAGSLHFRTKHLNCGNDKFNTLTFTSREDKWNNYEDTASYVIDSFKCV
ncbi:MAG: hypothetical protein CVT88_03105 [Candidatus Altiarchaeales archaeon HGW-Altiarchaeales-1]|nr:MAG: hypothetical protein CVT89_08240 [Candidatus Altiarchaeales archaeon HGW-Altiarchaeales-2]PKP60416.1 MAG: hypothetical protein CVT88_03105 [Candidatus Altiarchaeales archaeon HGW-Altiarchaeales-1]